MAVRLLTIIIYSNQDNIQRGSRVEKLLQNVGFHYALKGFSEYSKVFSPKRGLFTFNRTASI